MFKYKNIILVLVLLLIIRYVTVSNEKEIKINSYSIDIKFNNLREPLKVKANLNIELPQNSKEICLLFSEETEKLTVNNLVENKEHPLKFEKINGDSLKIFLPDKITNKSNINLRFEYSIPADTASENVYLYFWYPYIKDNLAEWKITCEIPKNYFLFSTGNIIASDTINGYLKIKVEQPELIPNFPAAIVKSDAYYKFSSTVDGTLINYFFLNNSENTRNSIISVSNDAFKFYNSLIGKYRYQQLTLCEIPVIPYVNSQPSCIFMGSVFVTYFDKGLNEWPAHEIAHQWIGSGILVKPSDTNKACISESLAEYLRLMFIESNFGEDSLNSILKTNSGIFNEILLGTEEDIPLFNAKSERVLYLKGPVVMNKIRNEIGRQKWEEFLKEIYRRFEGKFFTYNDFKDTLQNYCSDKSIIINFDAWMKQKGKFEDLLK